MPLLDHFHPPLAPRRHWESFHVNWAGAIADALNETLLPEGYFAEEHAQLGPWVEIDVATFTDSESSGRASRWDGDTAASVPGLPRPRRWLSRRRFPMPSKSWYSRTRAGTRLVAAIELVSPGNKDRAGHRQAFAVKCASYLCQGISLIVIDIVTSRRENLHNEIMQILGHGRTIHALRGDDAVRGCLSADRPRPARADRDLALAAGNWQDPCLCFLWRSTPSNVCRSIWKRPIPSRVNDAGWHEQAIERHRKGLPDWTLVLGEPAFAPYDESKTVNC